MTHTHQSAQALLNLAGLVARHDIRQTDLAEALTLTQPTVCQMLGGRADPKLGTLFRYLNAVNALAGTAYTLADIDPTRP